MNEEFLANLLKLKETGSSFVVASLVFVNGSAPQETGARIIVGNNGLLYGTVGGGKLEARAIDVAKELLLSDRLHHFAQWNLQSDIGMTCGGVVGVFFEKMLPQFNWKIAVFGAGHIAQELIRLLVRLECEVTCIDPRPEWLEKLPDNYKLKKIHSDDMKSVIKTLSPDTFIVSVTMGHNFDLPILKEALMNFKFPYVGAIGSESKARAVKKDLLNGGVDELAIAKLHCPIGESFGNNSVGEIAISIVAQLLKIRDSLSDKL